MTSFAFILGCVPLWRATGSGAVARQVTGTTVIGGMRAATLLAIFLIPVTYYVVERFATRRQRSSQGASATIFDCRGMMARVAMVCGSSSSAPPTMA